MTDSPSEKDELEQTGSSAVEQSEGTQDDKPAGEQYVEEYATGLAQAMADAVSTAESQDDGEDTEAETVEQETEQGTEDGSEKREDEGQAETQAEDQKPEGETGSDAEPESVAAQEEANADDSEVTEDEDVPFNKHPRFRQLISQRNDLKSEVAGLSPRAEQYDKITEFMTTTGLSAQDMAQGFRMMAMVSQDPVAARKELQAYVDQLGQVTGDKLPEDLQRQVDDGLVTEEIAKQFSRERGQRQVDAAQFQKKQQTQQAQQQQAQQQHLQAEQEQALSQWESGIASRDPDYERKYPWVFKQLQLLSQQKPPRNGQEAQALAQEAYDTVNKELERMMPQRKAVKQGPSSSDSASGATNKPVPETMEEAIRQAVS